MHVHVALLGEQEQRPELVVVVGHEAVRDVDPLADAPAVLDEAVEVGQHGREVGAHPDGLEGLRGHPVDADGDARLELVEHPLDPRAPLGAVGGDADVGAAVRRREQVPRPEVLGTQERLPAHEARPLQVGHEVGQVLEELVAVRLG
ncbi:MAG: hypothetical protein KDB10_13810 [Acidimicrobiales bacterium]|nr:hypothetical protein [Acidimicrobiales bacterium]